MSDTEEQSNVSMTIDDVDDSDDSDDVPEPIVAPVEEEAEAPVEEEAEAPVDEEAEEAEEPEPLPQPQPEPEPEPVVEEEEEAPVEEDEVEEEEAPVEEDEVEEQGTVEEEVEEQGTVEEEVEVEEEGGTKSLTQRIAELDYLRECCGNWVGKKRAGKALFLKSWSEKDIKEDESTDNESLLVQLEKLPELVKGWANKSINMKGTNHYQNVNGYSLQKPLFKEGQSNEEKVAVLEKLIVLLTDCAQGKLSVADIESQIDGYY
tara:strand:- start:4 stop:789 length:786 start_codon:yes stop_codon:yes gene_type:complete